MIMYHSLLALDLVMSGFDVWTISVDQKVVKATVGKIADDNY